MRLAGWAWRRPPPTSCRCCCLLCLLRCLLCLLRCMPHADDAGCLSRASPLLPLPAGRPARGAVQPAAHAHQRRHRPSGGRGERQCACIQRSQDAGVSQAPLALHAAAALACSPACPICPSDLSLCVVSAITPVRSVESASVQKSGECGARAKRRAGFMRGAGRARGRGSAVGAQKAGGIGFGRGG